MSFVEMGIGWFTPIERLLERVAVHGREHLEHALARGKGVLLFTAHFTTLEVGVGVLEALTPRASCMYRPQRNAMMDVMIRRGRHRFAKEQIPRDNVRALLRNLRDNYAVCYLPDQTYLGKQSELLPFFGEPAVTNTATSKLAAISGATRAAVLFPPLAGRRLSRRHRRAARRLSERIRVARHCASVRLARGLHPARARAVPLALQEIQGPPTSAPRRLRALSRVASCGVD